MRCRRAGAGDTPGAAAPEGADTADAAATVCPLPCSGQTVVGSVPARNGIATRRGHAPVARPPEDGSITAIVIPAGRTKSSAPGAVASVIKPAQAGSAACAPVRPRLCGWSKPTHTPHTIAGV